jgi:hypothetical protein
MTADMGRTAKCTAIRDRTASRPCREPAHRGCLVDVAAELRFAAKRWRTLGTPGDGFDGPSDSFARTARHG